MPSIFSKLLITLCVLVYVLLIPYLEWNDSHVFNPNWPPHARFHEVWQLFTHIVLGVFALYLAWWKRNIAYAAIICCCVMSGVIVANLTADTYAGSVLSGNLSKTVLGMELAVFIAVLVCVLSMIAVWSEKRATQRAN